MLKSVVSIATTLFTLMFSLNSMGNMYTYDIQLEDRDGEECVLTKENGERVEQYGMLGIYIVTLKEEKVDEKTTKVISVSVDIDQYRTAGKKIQARVFKTIVTPNPEGSYPAAQYIENGDAVLVRDDKSIEIEVDGTNRKLVCLITAQDRKSK